MSDEHTVVFLGPSLPRKDAQALLRADYRPPAARGDIYALLATGVKRIVVIDGVIHPGPAVWQRELLAAIDEGIEVLGASSVGALRAAELHPFGMQGFGTVFAWYRSELLDGDDEVALWHTAEELAYRPLSEPLVNLRATLRRAVLDAQITPDEERALVGFAKRTHYPDRTLGLLSACPLALTWPEPRREAWQRYLAAHAVDVQAEDARGVLAHCAGHPVRVPHAWIHRADPWSAEHRHVAMQFRRLSVGDPSVDPAGDDLPPAGGPAGDATPGSASSIAWPDLKAAMKRAPDAWDARIAQFTVDWCLADLARQRGVTCPEPVAQAYRARWADEHGGPDLAASARQRGLTLREHGELLELHALTTWLRTVGPAALGVPWDREAAEALAGRLPPEDRGVRADDAAFLAGWLEAQGFWYPHSERVRRVASWGLDTAARRRALVQACGLSVARLRQALDHRVAAMWLVGSGLRAFGRLVDTELAAVQAFQVSASLEELSAIAAAGRS